MVPRVEFNKDMQSLHQEIIRMGAMVEQAISHAVSAVIEMDTEKAKNVIAGDDAIDEMERVINRHCVEIIARQQPVARDLRDVTSTLKLITDLERIADHAGDISELVLSLSSCKNRIAFPYDIASIIQMAQNMLKGSLEAYVERDEKKAHDIILSDDKVDELYNRLKAYLVHLMSVDAQNVAQLVDLLLISKYAERIADHAQNVAEWVVYYIQGRYAGHEHGSKNE